VKVRWTARAANDLAEIVRFIATDNPQAALMTAQKIRKKVKRLAAHPKSGRIVPEFGNPAVREVLMGNYRTVYRIGKGAIDVLTVFEGHHLIPIDEEDISER